MCILGTAGSAYGSDSRCLSAYGTGCAQIAGAAIVFLFRNGWIPDIVDQGVSLAIGSRGSDAVFLPRQTGLTAPALPRSGHDYSWRFSSKSASGDCF
jgi:hypothetical protein